MCGAAIVAPLAMAAFSAATGKLGGGKVGSYTPPETDLTANYPTPETPEPTLGVDNTDKTNQAKRGKSALVIQRNPSVGIPGTSSGSGLAVAGG